MMTGGGTAFVLRRCGSTTETPWKVENHNLPSRPFQPTDCEPPTPWLLFTPSAWPYATDAIDVIRPSAKSFKSCLLTRKIPRELLIQRLPRPSSRISQITSSNRPLRVMYTVMRPSFRRFSPPPSVPIQTLPCWST